MDADGIDYYLKNNVCGELIQFEIKNDSLLGSMK